MKSWRIQRQNSSYTTKDLSFCQLASQLVRQQQAKSAGQLAALWWVLPNIACFYSQVDGLDHFTSFCTGYCQTLPQYSVVILSIMKTFCDTGLQTRSTSKTIYPYCSLSLLLQSFKEHVAVSTARLQVYKRFHGRPLMWELEFTCLFLPVKQIAATYFFSAAKTPRQIQSLASTTAPCIYQSPISQTDGETLQAGSVSLDLIRIFTNKRTYANTPYISKYA